LIASGWQLVVGGLRSQLAVTASGGCRL